MRKLLFFVVALAIAAFAQSHHFERLTTPTGGQMICAHCGAPENPPAKITITSRGEPREPLDMTGIVYLSDGKTPAAGYTLFVYHTGADGYYNHPNNVFQPRLYGYMKTGADGRYEFRTIMPGHYPDNSEPAHIHVHVFGPNYRERFLPEFWFDGDSLLKPSDYAQSKGMGDFAPIVKLSHGADGVWHGTRNFRLPPP